jgi:hypothetical protein
MIIAAVVFVSGAVWCRVSLLKSKGELVTVTQDGKVIYTLDLSREENRTITVEYEGRENVIEIKDGRIHMLEADCPDHTCINTGWLDNLPIICLPNKLVIDWADSDTDAVV